jgi:acetyl-CoA carboxylase carboxyltransferase component
VVKAKNAEGTVGAASNAVTFKTPPASDRITVASARFKAGDFRIAGTGSENGATVTLFASNAAGVVGAQIGTPTTIAVNAYEFRIRTNVPNPGYVVVKSNRGGVSAPFRVTT